MFGTPAPVVQLGLPVLLLLEELFEEDVPVVVSGAMVGIGGRVGKGVEYVYEEL